MEFKELKKLLQEPYSTQNWRALLGHVFQYVQFLDTPNVIPTEDNRVKELKQYGTVRLSDGKNLALFELTLHDNVNLIRNRVGLNELVKKYIDQDSYHGILSIFEQGKEDYRFTFTARNTEFDEEQGFIDKDTDTKRFTYILGANESCRTAAERFDTLSKTEQKEIKDVEDAFNVEKLSKKFFKEYIEQFNGLVASLQNKPSYYQAIFEKEERATRNFVKRFMGRLVFLKFIQKKGWLGVPVTETGWKNGDYQFLEHQYKNFENKGLFVSQFLNPLFYEALNVGDRPNNQFQNRGYKIPYLSGGLFDNENPKENRIDFEEQELTNLFDFFERYNFTIDENDVHDKEVGIDPEMLGHIFENLLEDNKDKGAFYTPKEIVRYMCQESLKEYLKTYLEKEQLWPNDETQAQSLTKKITAFVEKKETAAILRYDKELATALRDVKICDPAIGSGAFPMGLLNEIFTMIKNLHDESPDRVGDVWGMQGDTWQPNIVKQNIIQNSIYGVDIEAGAVDIARLRFWLSLVIEETEPKPLPHLDYKIVVGNSLVSKLEDTIIDIEWDLKPQLVQADIFGNEGKVTQKRELIREITALQKQVFEPNSNEEQLSISIRNKKIDLLVLQLEIMIDEKGVTDKPQGTGRNIATMTKKWLETKGWQQQITKLKTMKQGTQTPLEFFDWLLDFPEVMNPEVNLNPGFDIVIGNPPYIGQKGNKKLFQVLSESSRWKSFYERKQDYYYYFIAAGIQLTTNCGNLSFINPPYFMTASGGFNLREFIVKNSNLNKILDLSETMKVFDNASINSIILFLSNNIKYNNKKIEILKPKVISSKLNLQDINYMESKYSTKDLNGSEWYIYKDNKTIEFNDAIKLGDIATISPGIQTGCDKVTKKHVSKYHSNYFKSGDGIFIISNEEYKKLNLIDNEKKLVKPFFKNSDISKWHCNELNKYWVIITNYIEDINLYPNIKNHLIKFKPILDKRYRNFALINADKENKWWYLYGYRPNTNFEKEKIILPYRAIDNSFSFSEKPFYASIDVFFININSPLYITKYINSLLCSNLIGYWLQLNCKRKGKVLELYQKPLSNIPIIKASDKTQKKIVSIHDEIKYSISLNQDYILHEQRLNNIVYKLYNLTYEEALIVEPELPTRLTKAAYEAIEI